RDVFASTVETDDPRVLMALMRHTNLTTTTKYLRAMNKSMKAAVSGLGKTLGENLGENKNTIPLQKSAEKYSIRLVAELLKSGLTQEKLESYLSGGGQTRTVDSADMSRVSIPPSNWKQ